MRFSRCGHRRKRQSCGRWSARASRSSPTTSPSRDEASPSSSMASRPRRSTSSSTIWKPVTRSFGIRGTEMSQKTFAVALMDAPYESENLTTAFRILDAMAQRGHNINVFAYEGASGLAFAKQAPHPNPVHGKNLAEENHPTTKDQVAALLALAAKNGGKVDWVNCGMCVDERGVGEFVANTRRGSPADFHSFVEAADNVLAIPVK